MNNETEQTLASVVSDVLEKLAFMFTEPPEDEEIEMNTVFLHTTITFSGPTKGSMSSTAPEAFSRELASNILGIEPNEADEATMEDAMKEFANVVCGQLVATLYGSEAVFDLSVPALCRIDRSKWLELSADPTAIRLSVDEHPLLASLLIAE